MDNNSSSGKEKYVYLDFNGKIDGDVLKKQFFFCMANLDKTNPLVQVNDFLFKGTYDHAIGTNLFFDTEDNTEVGDAFHKVASIKAKLIVKQTEVLNLKPVKVSPRKIELEHDLRSLTYNFEWDYKTLLDKLENGTLRLQDIITTEVPLEKESTELETSSTIKTNEDEKLPGDIDVEDVVKSLEIEQPKVTELDVTHVPEQTDRKGERELQKGKKVNILDAEYQTLKVLAGRPTRRTVQDELVDNCDSKYREAYEYHNIEKQILQPCDAFKTEPVKNIDEETLSDCVDIGRCVFHSILSPSSDFPRKLTLEERKKVLRLDNFDNLSLCARYCVIKQEVDLLEEIIDNMPDNELALKDEFGRTPKETLDVYRKLKQALQRRIEEIKYANQN